MSDKAKRKRKDRKVRITDPQVRGDVVKAIVTGGQNLEPVIRRYELTEKRIQALRDLIVRIKPDLEFIRDQEPVILDALRVDALAHFQADPDRKWTVLEYAILLDKARTIRGESNLNISGLMGLVSKAEAREAERFKALAMERRGATDPAPGTQGGDPAHHPTADGTD